MELESSKRITRTAFNCIFHLFQGMRMSGENLEILYLLNLERESAGSYACGATNTEGETRSSSLTLKVQCKYHTNYIFLCVCAPFQVLFILFFPIYVG